MVQAATAPRRHQARLADAWRALRDDLERRGAAYIEEVSRYPTPIARCDLHLPEQLERRSRVFRLIRLMDETPGPDAAAARRLLAEASPGIEDARETELLEALRAACGGPAC